MFIFKYFYENCDRFMKIKKFKKLMIFTFISLAYGSLIEDGRITQEIEQRIGLTKINSIKNKNNLVSKKMIRDIKKSLFFKLLYDMLLYQYECEIWVINETEKRSLGAFEMWC